MTDLKEKAQHMAQATRSGFKGFALVRDKYGRPKIDNWETCPEEIKGMLTEEERKFLEAKHKRATKYGINSLNNNS